MNPFDSSIITFLNSFARHSWAFDSFVYMLSGNDLLKGGVVVALIWWTWFRPDADKDDTRQHLICAIFACLLAVVIARGLAIMLPFRYRPMTVAALHFQRPYGAGDGGLIDWSSFPSDHAAVFFALAMSILFVWRSSRNSGLILRLFIHKPCRASILDFTIPRIFWAAPSSESRSRYSARQTVLWLGRPLYHAVVGAFAGKLLRLSVYSDLRNRDSLSVHAIDRSFFIFSCYRIDHQ